MLLVSFLRFGDPLKTKSVYLGLITLASGEIYQLQDVLGQVIVGQQLTEVLINISCIDSHHLTSPVRRLERNHFDQTLKHRMQSSRTEQHDAAITHPTQHPRYPKWRLTTEKLLAAGHAALNSTDPAYLAYFKMHRAITALLERRLEDLKAPLEQDDQYRAAIEQQDKTLTPEPEQKTTTRPRPDLSEDTDIDFHM